MAFVRRNRPYVRQWRWCAGKPLPCPVSPLSSTFVRARERESERELSTGAKSSYGSTPTGLRAKADVLSEAGRRDCTELAGVRLRTRSLEEATRLIFSEMRAASADERLRLTASILKRMTQALVQVSGTLWSPKEIDGHLHVLFDLVNACPSRLAKWQESAAFEGAQSVLAHLRASCSDISTTEVATTVPGGCEPADFFEDVAELARLIAADYDLDKLIE